MSRENGGLLHWLAYRRLNLIDITGLLIYAAMSVESLWWALILVPTFVISGVCEAALAARKEETR